MSCWRNEFSRNYHFSDTNCNWWRRQWHPTPVLLPGKSHGWRDLVGCSPWGRWESDTTERLHFHFSLSWIGEGNGNPLQCSCLENPRDGGAWWSMGSHRVGHYWSDLAAAAAEYKWQLSLLMWVTIPWVSYRVKKKGPTIQHKELYSILCNGLYGKRI